VITVHPLEHSRSHRVLWLLEELGRRLRCKESRDRSRGPAEAIRDTRLGSSCASAMTFSQDMAIAAASAIRRVRWTGRAKTAI